MRSPKGGRPTLGARLSASILVIVVLAPIAVPPITRIAVARAEGGQSGTTASVDQIEKQVAYGERFTLRGTITPPIAGSEVILQRAARYGWESIARATTTATGRYTISTRAKTTASVRIQVNGGEATSPQLVPVAARIRAHGRPANAWFGRRVGVAGKVLPAVPGRKLEIQARIGRSWRTEAAVLTGAAGKFRAPWKPARPGVYPVRVRFAGDQASTRTITRVGHVAAFKPDGASYYGPGGTTACGQTLTAATQGVAHKTLPCGTRVTLYYNGRTVRVPVIDRGPFVAGRDWDLTVATKRKLGFGSTGTVGSAW